MKTSQFINKARQIVADNTFGNTLDTIAKHLPVHKPISEITQREIDHCVNKAIKTKRSDRSVFECLSALRVLFRLAQEHNHFDHFPDIPIGNDLSKSIITCLDDIEYQCIIRQAEKIAVTGNRQQRNGALIILLTGKYAFSFGEINHIAGKTDFRERIIETNCRKVELPNKFIRLVDQGHSKHGLALCSQGGRGLSYKTMDVAIGSTRMGVRSSDMRFSLLIHLLLSGKFSQGKLMDMFGFKTLGPIDRTTKHIKMLGNDVEFGIPESTF